MSRVPGADVAPGPAVLGGRAARGALALLGRQGLSYALMLASGVVLARLLAPADFGVYVTLTVVYGLLGSLGDGGIATGLLQQRDEPLPQDYAAARTYQLLAAGILALLLWAAAAPAARCLHWPAADAWAVRVVGLALVAQSARVVPAVHLERALRYDRLGLVGAADAVVFAAVSVLAVLAGFGVTGLALGLLLQALVGTCLLSAVARGPRVGWSWRGPGLRRSLRVGLPYQASSLVSFVKDALSPIYVGLLLGAAAVGYVEFASRLAAYALFALFALQRLYLSLFARVQADRAVLASCLEGVLWCTNAVVAPLSVLTLVLADPIVRVVFGAKWLPALPLFWLLWAANLLSASASPLLSLLNAVGRSHLGLGFAVLWMALTWALGVPLLLLLGRMGFGVANLAVQATFFLLLRAARRQVPFRFLPVVAPPWLVAGVVGVGVFLLSRAVPGTGWGPLLLDAVAGLVLYLAALSVLQRERLAQLLGLARTAT